VRAHLAFIGHPLVGDVLYGGPALEGLAHHALHASKVAFVPKNKKAVSGRDAEVCLNLVYALDDQDDVQTVYADFDISDEELQRIAGAS
jgi:hypothetical protein